MGYTVFTFSVHVEHMRGHWFGTLLGELGQGFHMVAKKVLNKIKFLVFTKLLHSYSASFKLITCQ